MSVLEDVSAKEPCISAKEPCISAKEPGISAKEPCISAKEPCIPTKEPCIFTEKKNDSIENGILQRELRHRCFGRSAPPPWRRPNVTRRRTTF